MRLNSSVWRVRLVAAYLMWHPRTVRGLLLTMQPECQIRGSFTNAACIY